jgi:hypothetical protein
VPDRPGHDRRYAIDATKIMTELGWYPEHSFEEAMPKTIEWYINNHDWSEAVLRRNSGINDHIKIEKGSDKPVAPSIPGTKIANINFLKSNPTT